MILDEICANRRKLLDQEKQIISHEKIKDQCKDLIMSGYKPADFLANYNPSIPFLIAEIKKASPSKGLIRKDFNINEIALAYKASPYVSALSVLTEPEYFKGNYAYINKASKISGKPVLMKDFIIDEYQIYKGFAEGASAILLIAAVLNDSQLRSFSTLASELNMAVLTEAHDSDEFRRALKLKKGLIGINNRDLKTFITDINTTIKILGSESIHENSIIISESGIGSKEDIHMLTDAGVNGFLIGEKFMKEKNITKAVSDLFASNV